jgi:hypothetical protein
MTMRRTVTAKAIKSSFDKRIARIPMAITTILSKNRYANIVQVIE